jgi:hypothetical protein
LFYEFSEFLKPMRPAFSSESTIVSLLVSDSITISGILFLQEEVNVENESPNETSDDDSDDDLSPPRNGNLLDLGQQKPAEPEEPHPESGPSGGTPPHIIEEPHPESGPSGGTPPRERDAHPNGSLPFACACGASCPANASLYRVTLPYMITIRNYHRVWDFFSAIYRC